MKRTWKIINLVLTLGIVMSIGGCKKENSTQSGSDKLTISVSIPPEAAFVKAVAGDLAEVVTLIPPGNSPENYEPTPQQLAGLSNSDIYFSIEVPTEESFINKRIPKNVPNVDLAAAAKELYPELTIGESRDPHVWLSPNRASVMVDEIAKQLSLLDADNSAIYLENAADYVSQLETLDSEIQAAVSDMRIKKILVYHPAFAYLCDDYGLEMLALEEEGKEATPKQIEEMIDRAHNEGIKALFYQEEMSQNQAKAFAEEIGGKAVMLSPLSEDYINNYKNMINLIKEACN